MPRIRKKTSNRTKILDRVKLKKKVKDSRKKKVRAAKKNRQWKSKDKDPGIPNDFPYKDQILAEVAEQRRIDAAAKERKKEEKRVVREQAKGVEGEDEQEAPKAPAAAAKKDLNVGIDAIQGLSAKILSGQMETRPAPEVVEESDEDEDEVPALVNRDLPTLQAVLEVSDVLLQVIDARDPLEYRSQHLEDVAKERGIKFAFVLTKIDACPREAVSAWLSQLRSQHPTFLFRSATAFLPPGKGKSPVADALGAETLLNYLHHLAKEKKGDAPLTVAVTGVTNVGKSALINSLARRSALPIYSLSKTSRGATTTELPQEVEVEANGTQIRIIDTPGLSFELDHSAENKDELRGRDILLRSRGRIDKLKDPAPPVSYIISRANNEDLMLLYNLAAFAKNDATAFLSGLARANQMVKRKGELDLAGASRLVLRHWSTGKFSRYATPVKPTTSLQGGGGESSEAWLTFLYAAADEGILSTLRLRKELRKTAGLVRFTSGSVDDRKTRIGEQWASLDAEESEEEGEDRDFEMEEEVAVPEMKKRKRGANPPLPSPPFKKVAFATQKAASARAATRQELSTTRKKAESGPEAYKFTDLF